MILSSRTQYGPKQAVQQANRLLRLRFRRYLSSSSSSSDPPTVTVYQYAICPFCNKAKAVLHYLDIPYEAVEVNPLTKAELKSASSDGYRKVPIAKVNDEEQLNGSDTIIEHMLTKFPGVSERLSSKSSLSMQEFMGSDVAKKWNAFASEELAYILYPNLCPTWSKSYKAFDYVHTGPNNFGPFQKIAIQNVGSLAMWMAASRIKKKRAIDDEKEALDKLLSDWTTNGLSDGKGAPYSSGTDDPNLGDLAVYGTLRSVEGLVDGMLDNRPVLDAWYRNLKEKVESP